MNILEAALSLRNAERHELRDHAFGDVEITWTKMGIEIASGYMGGDVLKASVQVGDDEFVGADALSLVLLGRLAAVERNDTTGPAEFVAGKTMPGLTREGVREELTRKNIFDKES